MKKEKVIITGSEGVVGIELSNYLNNSFDIKKTSLRYGDDLTDEDFVKRYFSKNKAQYLINCFGYNDHVDDSKRSQTLFDVSLNSFEKYLSINVVALFSVCREFAKQNESKGIINLSSIYSMVSPLPKLYDNSEKHIGYSVSKAAVNQLTKHLSTHLAPKIRVNCVVLGGIETKHQKSKFKSKYSENVPMGRMMRVDEIGGIIEYLCSERSTYTTGSIINLDGGWTAW